MTFNVGTRVTCATGYHCCRGVVTSLESDDEAVVSFTRRGRVERGSGTTNLVGIQDLTVVSAVELLAEEA